MGMRYQFWMVAGTGSGILMIAEGIAYGSLPLIVLAFGVLGSVWVLR
jgi:hypothetical protein